MQCSSKVSSRSPQRKTSIRTKPAAEYDRNNFSLPRTSNVFFSRHKAMFLRNSVPSNEMFNLFLARRPGAEYRSLRVHKTHLGRKKLDNLCNLRLHQFAKDNAVNGESLVKTVQRNFRTDESFKSVKTSEKTI